MPERVEVTGPVADVGPWYGGALLAAVPLHAGGGTSIKALEAIAHGRPVVATSTGVRGLPLRPGRDVLVGDDAATFAVACATLLGEPERAARQAASAAATLGTRFTVDTVASELAALFTAATVRP